MNIPITIVPPTLPAGYCYSGWQDFVEQLFNNLSMYISTDVNPSRIVFGSSVPAASLQAYPWYRTAGDSKDGFYHWNAALVGWVRAHPMATSFRMLVDIVDPAEITTFDGGDADAAGLASGPMWEIDTNYAGRSPMGPGAIPDTTKTLAAQEDYGSGTHALVANELPKHTHGITLKGFRTNLEAGIEQWYAKQGPGDGVYETTPENLGQFVTHLDIGDGVNWDETLWGQATPQSVSLVHPVRGTYVIKRTARKYYKFVS